MTPSNGKTPVGQSDGGPKPPTTAEGAYHAHNSIRAHIWQTRPPGRSDAPRRRILKRAAPHLHPNLVVHHSSTEILTQLPAGQKLLIL